MNESHPNRSDELLNLDPPAPTDRRRYDQEMRNLFDRKPSPADWFKIALMGVGGLAAAGVCGVLAATEPAGLPTRTRVALAAGAGIGLFWASLAGVLVRRGRIHSAVHGAVAARMGFGFALLAAVTVGVLVAAGRAGQAGASVVLLPVVPLVLAAVVLVTHEVRQGELRTRQKLLEIEYRLARLAEADGHKS